MLARSKHVPSGILVRANDIWRTQHPDEFYGYSYRAMDPRTYAQQQLGLILTTAFSNQILRAHGKAKSRPAALSEKSQIGHLLLDDAGTYLLIDTVIRRGATNLGPCTANPPSYSPGLVPMV